MIAIGRYVVFTMFVTTATILSAHDINDNDMKNFMMKIKLLHNEHRLTHLVEILKLDEDLSKTANAILNNYHGEKTEINAENVGVNVARRVPLTRDSKLDDEEAARLFAAWYNTGASYNYDKNPSTKRAKKAAPFTQIVWASTKIIGLAMSVDTDYYDFIVTYSPQGNIKKQYKDNVFRPT